MSTHPSPLPCPFCGATGKHLEFDAQVDGVPVVHCLRCDALGPNQVFENDQHETYNKASAIRAWNQRAK